MRRLCGTGFEAKITFAFGCQISGALSLSLLQNAGNCQEEDASQNRRSV